ncbi:MAG TPA: LamG-like jellyroll fold domain-containing protein [Thermoleophilaceae bacterium]
MGSLTERLASPVQDCPSGNCTQTWDTTFSPAAGDQSRTPRRMRVQATDQAGNTSSDRQRAPAPAVRWRLDDTVGNIAADSVPRAEQVTNTSFETDTSGWASVGAFFLGNSTLTRIADSGAPHGGYVAKVVAPEWQRGIGTDVTVTAGVPYRVRVKVKRDPGGQEIRIGLGEIAAPNEELVVASNATPSTTGYSDYTGVVVPNRSGTYRLYVRAANYGGPPTTFYVDSASVKVDYGGTYAGGYTQDRPGATTDGDKAVSFDGTNGRVGTHYKPFVNGTASTFEGWAKRTDTSGTHTLFGGNASTRAPILYVPEGSRDILWYSDVGTGQTRWPDAAPTGAWFHWAYVFDEVADTAELFINGVSRGVRTVTDPYNATPGNLSFGAYAGGSNGFKGSLDDVAVYPRALSATEIARLYSPDPSDARVAYWRLNESTGTTAADSAPHHQHVSNTSFESDTSGWASTGAFFLGSSTLTRVADSEAPDGDYVAKVEAPEWQRGIGTDMLLTAGRRYRVRVKLKREPGSQQIRVGLGEIASPNEELVIASNAVPGSAGYTEYTGVATPSRTGTYRLYVRAANAGGPPSTFYVDAATVTEDNAGTYTGGYTLNEPGATADADRAVRLNGSSGYVAVPDAQTLDLGDRLSIEAWFKRSSLTGDQILVGKGQDAYVLMIAGGKLTLRKGGAGNIVQSTATPGVDGQWHHVVATKDGPAAKIYLDGVDVSGAVSTLTLANNSAPLNIGTSAAADPEKWNGWVDDVALYSAALSGADVARLQKQHVYDWRVVFDNGAPVLDAPVRTPSGTAWVNGTTQMQATLAASDPVSGIKRFKLFTAKQGGGEDLQTKSYDGCSENVDNLCDTSERHTFTYTAGNMPEGSAQRVRAVAEDTVANVSAERSWDVKVDRTGANVGPVTGPLSTTGRWVRPGVNYSFESGASDSLSGVESIQFFVNEQLQATQPGDNCTPQGCASNPSPKTFSWTVPDPYTGQGDPSLRVKANDLAGNPGSSRTWNVRVDDDKPAVPTVTGTLKDAEGKFVNGASFTVHVDASDGTSQSPSSGVKQIRLLVGADPSSLTLRKESPVQTCATQNCTQPWDTTFSPLSTDETRAGRLIRVEVEDQMGHVEKRDWYAGFDRTAPSAASPTHADPEDWWYSETAQRTATVNATDSTSGVASVRLSVPQLGGGPSVQDHPFGCSNVVPATCATSGSHPFGYGLANVPEGQVSVTGRATDVAGNNSWDVTRTVKVDKSAPQFVSKSGTASVDGLWLDDGEHDVTVDWNDAFSGVSSSRVAFQAPSLALDGFERTALAGWGEADAGGPWSAIEGPASDFSVAAGRASVSSPQGSPRTAVLGSTPARAFMARVKVRLPDVPPASGWSEAAIVNSHSSGSFHVRAALELYPDGHLELLFRDKANNELARTDLGMSHVAGDDYYLTFQKPGGMSIRAKAWKVGTPEPAFPQVLISDPYVYSGGSRLGLRAINGAAVTQSTAFDDLDVQPLRSGDYEEPFKSGGCDRTGCAGPMSHSFTWSTAGEPQGLHHVSPTAADPVGHQTQGTQWAVGLDRSGPALALSGALKDADGQTVYREDMALHMDARDGRAGNDATRRSGTERLQVWVDRAGPQDPADHDQSQACTPDSCAMEGDYTFSPTEHGPGAHTITVRATDKVGNQTEQTVTVTVAADEAGPELELSGDLRPPLATGRSVHIKALEERPADTGVRKIELWLDPDLTPTSDEREHGHEPDCSAGCPSVAETDWALDQATPPGKHEILIVATDDAGHRTEERYEIHVLDLLPSSRSKLGLEHWFDYDDTAAGGDSSVYVNGETGNTVWHSVPVVNPGRGLSTVVNLTYNSHDRGGVLGSTLGRVPLVDLSGQDLNNDLPGLSYSEAGVGFSLGISGPTRLNEPLGGVLIAQAVEEGEAAIPGFTGTLPGESNLVVTMTDSDGTVHTFTKGADGEWIAPPGVSMRLRRFQNGGTLVNPIDEKWALTRPDGITHFFDNLGYLTKTKDRNDNVLEYIYEPYDALTGNVTKSVVTSSGQNLDYALCDGVQLGKQTEVTLPDGTEVPVFCAKRVSRVKDPAGRELKIDYNDYDSSYLGLADGKLPIEFRADFPGLIGGRAGRINKITDHANREYTFEYDDHGYLTKFVEAANRPEKRTTELAYEDWKPGLEAIGQDRQLIEVKEGETGRKTLIRHVHPDDRTTLPTPGVLLLPRQACGVTKRNDGVGDLESVPVANQECRTADNDLEKTYDYTAPEGSTPRKFEVDEILMRAQAVGESATVGTTVHEIDDEGRPEAVTDPNGVKTALTWNEDVNAVSSIEEASGTDDASRTELDYDQANRTAVIAQQRKYPNFPSTDGARVTNFSYQFSNGRHHSTASGVSDADGQFVADMTEVRNPKTGTGQSFEIEQVAGAYTGNVTKRWDKPGKSGNVATTLYDGHGQIISEDDEVAENGPTIYEQHDPTGQPQKVLDPSGKRWDYLYDAVGNLTTVVDPRATDRSGAAGLPYTTTLGYDALDRLVNERIPRLSADSDLPDSKRFTLRSREFNRNGTLKTATDGEGTTTSMTYTPMDQPLRVTAPGKAGRPETTDHVYDDADRLIARVEPKGTGATVATAGEHQKACTDASVDPPVVDHMTRYCLDRGGQMIAEVRAATVLPPNGGPSALIKSFAYDRRGNVTGIVDPLRNSGRSIREATDAAQVSDPLTTSRRLTYEYDRVDERTAQIEHVTETGPDGRLPAKRTAYEYDANGNKLTVLPPKAFVGRSASDPDRDYQTKTSYDHRDLEVAVRTPAGCSAYQRREDGRITAITAPRGTTATDADDCSAAGPFKYHTTKLTYDAQGNLASRTIPFAQGQYGRADSEFENWKVTYERDDVGNATSIEDPRGNEFDNTFFDGGQLRSTTRPSWYELEWSDDHAPRDPAQRYKQEKDAGGDFELADGGPEIRESEIMSRNAQPEGERSDLPETHGQGDFGKVDPQDPGDLLPEAGATNLDYDREMRLTTISDAAGGDRTISYDEAGRVIGKSWPFKPDDPITHDFEYDLNGNLERYTDGRGKPTTYGYDGFDRRISETTRGAGRAPGDAFTEEVTRFAYDANDNLEWRQTPRGTALRFDFAYDSTDHLISEANPANDTWEYDYDVNGNRVKERSPRYQSATAGDKPDFERTFTYDPANRMTEDDPGLGDGFTTYEYDADGNVTEMTSGGAADANGAASARRKQTSSYDGRRLAWRRTTSTAGGDDKRTQIQEYDANGNLRRMIQGKGVEDHSRAKVLDAPGTSTADVTWHATLRDYDEDDQLVAVHSPWSRPPSEGSPAVDDPDGPSDAETGGDDRKIVQDFLRPTAGNPLRRVTSIVAPHESSDTVAARTSYTYFANGWVKTQSDEKLVRPGSTAPVRTANVTYDYDKAGNQTVWKTDEAGDSPDGRLVKRFFYDDGTLKRREAYKTKAGTDDETRRTYDYFYNENRSLVRIDDFDATAGGTGRARSTKIKRDEAERESVVNEDWDGGRDTVLEYDRAGNVTTRKTDGIYVNPTTYNGDERKVTTFDYDALDRETSAVVDPAEGDTRTTTTTWWDSNDMKTRTKSNGTVESYFYNARGEMAQKRRNPDEGDTETQDYDYDRDGNRTQDERGTHVFNPRGQLVKWTRGPKYSHSEQAKDKDGTVVTYERNAGGDVTKEVDNWKPTGITGDTTTTYRYHGERLIWTETSRPTVSGTQTTHSDYSYDDFGSVTKVVHEQTGPGSDPNEPPDGPPSSVSCSEMPNEAEAKVTRYCYDEFERRVQSRGSGIEKPTIYVYDGLDRRDRKTVEENGDPKVHEYAYVGLNDLLSRETDKDGKKKTYDYDSDGRRLGQSVKASGDSAPTHRPYATDASGSVEGLEDTEGRFGELNRDTYLYDPYGESENVGGLNETEDPGLSDAAKENPFRFQGFYFDSGVKTYDMQARDYRPDIGRFLSEDRYEAAVGDKLLQADPLTQNRYAFAGGNPVNNVEFDGHHIMRCYSADHCSGAYEHWRWHRRQAQIQKQRRKDTIVKNAQNNARQALAQGDVKRYYRNLAVIIEQDQAKLNRRVQALQAAVGPLEAAQPKKPGFWDYAKVVFDPTDPLDILLTAASAIPTGATQGAKGAKIALKGAKLAARVAKAGKVGKALSKVRTLLAGAVSRAGDNASLVNRLRQCGNSFTARTPVVMADGSRKPIARVRLGDYVVATDSATGRTVAARVNGLLRSSAGKDLTVITVGGRRITATDHHPVFVLQKGRWVDAADLEVGDLLLGADGEPVPVSAVRDVDADVPVYNLTVNGIHTYYAGDRPVLVHNSGSCDVDAALEAAAAELKQLNRGKNRVTINTPGGRMVVDLQGKAHYSKAQGRNVPTPHVKMQTRNQNPLDPNQFTFSDSDVFSAGWQEIRIVRQALSRRAGN